MGRKGVSKRKPKKSKSGPNDNNHGSSNARRGESPLSVQSFVNNAKDAPPERGGLNPSGGSSKKNRKGRSAMAEEKKRQ